MKHTILILHVPLLPQPFVWWSLTKYDREGKEINEKKFSGLDSFSTGINIQGAVVLKMGYFSSKFLIILLSSFM